MRIGRLQRVLVLACALGALGGLPASAVAAPSTLYLEEDLKVALPTGEQTLTVVRFPRVPGRFSQPAVLFSAEGGATARDMGTVRRIASEGAWVVLLDLKKLDAELKTDEQFAAVGEAVAGAMLARMREAVGPLSKKTPKPTWPVIFGGTSLGAVRAAFAANAYQGAGKLKGLLLINPKTEAPSIEKGGSPIRLSDQLEKISVTPVAFIAPGWNETFEELKESIAGHTSLKHTPEKGMRFISMRYPYRYRKTGDAHSHGPKEEKPVPKPAPAQENPADLFRPGG